LNHDNHDKGERGNEKADSNFSEGGERENFVDCGINHVVDQRDKNQNENGVSGLDLSCDQIHPHPVQIHLLGLQCPFCAVAHSPQPPEKQNEKINHRDAAKGNETFFAESFL
jgi:hypothetical protein